jgi:hypothetical protein
MKLSALFATILALSLTACVPTPEEKIQSQLTEAIHSLKAEERILAEINAKQYFEKEFPVASGDSIKRVNGAFLECRPSDSNFNGLVTCRGKIPKDGGGFSDVTRYCGYTKTLVGCSDQDTVKVN